MNAPTPIERDHYTRLVGRQITGIQWEELEGQPLPVLLLDGDGRDLQPAHAVTRGRTRRSSTVLVPAKICSTNRGRMDTRSAMPGSISRDGAAMRVDGGELLIRDQPGSKKWLANGNGF